MKIYTKKNKTKLLAIIISGVLLAAVTGALIFVYAFNGNLLGWQANYSHPATNKDDTANDPIINEDPATDEQIDAGEKIKKDNVNPTKQPAGAPSSVGVIITTAEQTDSMLRVRVLIQTITNTGTCTLTLSKDSVVITKHADVQAQANATTCKGFDIPLTELSAGEWSIAISFSNTTQTGAASVVKIIK